MILPDKRLAVCADLVTGGFAADIGTDHAYLPSFLVRSGKCERAIASDINPGPLEAARRTLIGEGTADRVELFLADGTKGLPLEGVTDIICAGMGGELISRIILEDERTREMHIIAQPMSRAEHLRKSLFEAGFSIDEERAVRSKGHVYTAARFVYTGRREYDEASVYTGGLSPLREDDREYVRLMCERMKKAAIGMAAARPDEAAYNEHILALIGEKWKL